MKPILVLYQPEEDELCALYEQGYRIAGVTYVVGIGTKVYMQIAELSCVLNEPARTVGKLYTPVEPDVIP